MNKRYLKYLLLVTIMIIAFTFTTYADSQITVRHNDKPIDLSAPVEIVDGRSLLPLRDIFGVFGFEVGWDDTTKTVIGTRGDFRIKLPIDSHTAEFNGDELELEVPASLVNNRTYVPVRFVSEVLDATVNWNDHFKRIDIYTTAFNDKVEFENRNLEKALLSLVGKTEDDDIIREDLRYLINVDLSGKVISKLGGIEYLINVKTLNLDNNLIHDLDSLTTLSNLNQLTLNDNQLKSVYQLKSMHQLEHLELADNFISSLNGLEDLSNLKFIRLKNNELSGNDDYIPLYYLLSQLDIDVVLTNLDEPKYDTWNLRYQTSKFKIEVEPSIFWIPADYHGSTNLENEDTAKLLVNSPSGKGSQIKRLYELLQFMEHYEYKLIDDDKASYDEDNKRMWIYPKPASETLSDNYGSNLALANAVSFMLVNDYAESGYLIIIDKNNNKQYLNYIRTINTYYVEDEDNEDKKWTQQDVEYSIFDPKSYLPTSKTDSAVEDGRLESYENSLKLKGNIHLTDDLMKFVNAYIPSEDLALVISVSYYGDERELFPLGTYYDGRGAGGIYHFYPKNESSSDEDDNSLIEERYDVLYDDPNDTFYIKSFDNDTNPPKWK